MAEGEQAFQKQGSRDTQEEGMGTDRGNIKRPTAMAPPPMTLKHGPGSERCSHICQPLKAVI